ncbi:uncharacterized protein C1orf198-like [Mya arenaria]|uniref:uncharacterized protein C1orf198-like n=1 Tax=Mya arenaria TaxID=6604 RepID=UPI0022E51A54|nr:uncharacterized protein C1orf198-like [Mya arenaria]
MEEKYKSYMSKVNPIASKIIKDEAILKRSLKTQWKELGLKEQEMLLDDYLVDMTVREKYANIEKLNAYGNCFPKMKVETGEKIVVDFDNDCWTWQDEHSSPFNWRTKSQQDLTLDDLEPDVLCKVPSKGKRRESEVSREPSQDRESREREFSVNSSGTVWMTNPLLRGVDRPELIDRCRSSSPCKSVSTSKSSPSTSRSKTPDAINYGFTGSVDDLSSSQGSFIINRGSLDMNRSPSVSSREILSYSLANDPAPTRPARRQRSFSRSPVKSLISRKSEDDETLVTRTGDNHHAFDNQAMGENWSSFVNQGREDDTSSGTPSPYRTLLVEPQGMGMDRGVGSELLRGSMEDEEEDYLQVTKPAADETDSQNASKTGFDFLDNW